MIQRWMLILSNWNNCYFNERTTNEQTLNIESLVNIISYLRHNLDESKSSKLEAHTVNEFITEKYPSFQFENGTVEPASDNEEEVYMVASLLLFFVCVNSKDIDIKNAMCSKLSGEDQKIILKFSKSLMECPETTYRDVQAAITEACGQDIATMEISPRVTVAETPPALRSLHSEVRRLQAALDAERFDRNYLQEELNRTNLKVEKLLKDKEQYKLDILNLKAKISLSGSEGESTNATVSADRSAKLTRELQLMEEKLVDTQAQLDDTIYERQVYKTKVEELKQERDKYLSLSQQEASRVSQLSEELETERQNVQALKDMIAEFRQHNKLNRLDSSLLECDDPDASMHSLPHNSSMCSEVCANVVEVQLGEERAKIVVLKQQIQSMQDQLNELNKKTEAEKKSLESIISDSENHIFNLKHRINEEIQEKNNIKAQHDFEVTKLNNELNELEQRFKDNRENSRSIIDKKMQEIQSLQEEKLSLIQSLNNKTTKFENVIKDLKNKIETEKVNKSTMKENYEKQIMKLNEKVLNRNNELVELQNSIFEYGETIEKLQIQLKQEKEQKEEINNKLRELEGKKQEIENELQQKIKDINEFQIKLQKNNTIIEDMKDKVLNFQQTVVELNNKSEILEKAREDLINQVRDRDNRIMEGIKEIQDNSNRFSKEIKTFKIDLDEKNAMVDTLQKQLENEIAFKVQVQSELDKSNASLHQANIINEQLNSELSKMKIDVEDKNKTIDALDLYLKEEKKINSQANDNIEKLTSLIRKMEKEIKQLNQKLVEANNVLTREIELNKENVEIAQHKLFCETAEKEALQLQLNALEEEIMQMGNVISKKCDEINVLRAEIGEHLQRIHERDELIKLIENQFVEECKKYDALESNFEAHMTKVMKRFNKMGKFVVHTTDAMRNEIIEKVSCVQKLNNHLFHLKEELEFTKNDLAKVMNENNELDKRLHEEMMCKNNLQQQNEMQSNFIENLKTTYSNDFKVLTELVQEKCQDMENLKSKLDSELKVKTELTFEMNTFVNQLKERFSHLESVKKDMEQKLTQEIDEKSQTIVKLQREIEQLQFTIKENNSNHALIIKQNNATINKLNRETTEKEEKYRELLVTSEHYDLTMTQALQQKNDEIALLNNKILELEHKLNKLEKLNNELQEKIAETLEINRNINIQLIEEKAARDAFETEKDQEIKALLYDKETLQAEKAKLSQEICDEISNKKIAEQEKNALIFEKIQIKEHLADVLERTTALEMEKAELIQQLEDLKIAKESAERERDNLDVEKVMLEQKLETEKTENSHIDEQLRNQIKKLQDLQELYASVLARVHIVVDEKEKLTEELSKEKSNNSYFLGENEQLTKYIDALRANIENANATNEKLKSEVDTTFAEKEALIETIEIERSAREVSDREKTKLAEEINYLKIEITFLKVTLDKYETDLKLTEQKMLELNVELQSKEKHLNDLIDNIKNTMTIENQKLIEEKASLIDRLNIIENGNKMLNESKKEMEQLKDNFETIKNELEIKTMQVKKYEDEISILRNNLNDVEKLNSNISSILDVTLNNILEKMKEDTFNDYDSLKSLQNEKIDSIEDKCQFMTQIAETLLKEVECLINEENMLKSEVSKLTDVKNLLEQKNKDVEELQSEVNRLEQALNDNKIEATKQYETYNTTLNSKLKDIETVQRENQQLHNDLKDVKFQLEVKVHSLKEKLVDNENVTDKLKSTYECQIDNLNVMVTKLTNYLKEKAGEIESLKQDKENLSQTIEDSGRVIKTLNEELMIEKQNMDKVISEFESERLVLKNMITVTESVMEDQKICLNDIIADHLKAKETLLENNNELINNIKELNAKVSNMEIVNTFLLKMLRQERELKRNVESESEVLRQCIDEVITELRNERNLIETLEAKKIGLVADVEKYKDDIESIKGAHDAILKQNEGLENDIKTLNTKLENLTQEKSELETTIKELKHSLKHSNSETKELKDKLNELIKEKHELIEKENSLIAKIDEIKQANEMKSDIVIDKLKNEKELLLKEIGDCQNELEAIKKSNEETKLKFFTETESLKDEITILLKEKTDFEMVIKEKTQKIAELKATGEELRRNLIDVETEKQELVADKNIYIDKLEELNQANVVKDIEVIHKLQDDNKQLLEAAAENKTVIKNLEQLIQEKLEENTKLREEMEQEKQSLINKCTILQEYHNKAETLLEDRMKEINILQKELSETKVSMERYESDSKAKDSIISKVSKEKDAIISGLTKELTEEKALREKAEKEYSTMFTELTNIKEVRRALMKENEQLTQAIGQQETYAALCQERAGGEKCPVPAERRDIQVDNTFDTHSSLESLKTITDLEKIIHDKNRTITTLQSDITYLKTMMAESETKLLDVDKELEVTKENCQQLSSQLKKIVFLKNEEIAELKKQVSKMSATETRATQIIKVSAKYQAMILKRIAEIKSNTILKELTNFGNTNSSDIDLRRSLNAGTITMEELENFLDTTDRHLKRCAEKQIALQKERDRLSEVNRINESEIINLKKFLNELSLSFQTFNSIKNLYAQKLSRVISVQRTVRREILNLDGRVTDVTMCKLERGYAAVMQDLSECAMNLERWVERCISRTVSVEKIKQAFTSDSQRSSLASPSFQNTGLEIQLDELEKSFEKLLEEVSLVQNGEGARESTATTVMEVRAQYEDKLNRMKAKMKELLNEQMTVLKEKQRGEIALLERELQKTRDKMEASKRSYEEHIRDLTKELWNYGERYLVKNDEAEWLKRKHRTGSLMSLQQMHSGGLMPPQEVIPRLSDTHSLRSLPVTNAGNTKKREGRGLHMSDEEGEVFDNRCLRELSTPRRDAPPGQRLSELRWRNSLCPPHLKSSYPAETQFITPQTLDEEEIKAGSLYPTSKQQRKEVGITAYKKPGPPTPSKQAGRLSATDSELRESLRVEADPHPDRKTSTPARIRAFLSFKNRDTTEGTPRVRRLSNIFRKK